jgi:hypothetical protein
MVVSTEADAEEMKRLDERFQAARATNDGYDQGTHNVNVDRNNHDVFHVTDNASLDPKPTSDPERSDNMKNTGRKAGKARAKRLEKGSSTLGSHARGGTESSRGTDETRFLPAQVATLPSFYAV